MEQVSKKKKLTLTVHHTNTLESRSSPHTACPDSWYGNSNCCETSIMNSQKLTAVAFF